MAPGAAAPCTETRRTKAWGPGDRPRKVQFALPPLTPPRSVALSHAYATYAGRVSLIQTTPAGAVPGVLSQSVYVRGSPVRTPSRSAVMARTTPTPADPNVLSSKSPFARPHLAPRSFDCSPTPGTMYVSFPLFPHLQPV